MSNETPFARYQAAYETVKRLDSDWSTMPGNALQDIANPAFGRCLYSYVLDCKSEDQFAQALRELNHALGKCRAAVDSWEAAAATLRAEDPNANISVERDGVWVAVAGRRRRVAG